ncbi:SWIM zinc finger family protein [Bacillus sp. ISL-41]|uniref:SWIM zinc finger family protein n=1 Tax=Bacillus sp. ISL-41 TaxID=2819127 RepID=UPI001BE980CC|nr:SWIM zinc finger family protein [Bacillus sp. ISL-41]MBT2645109.1 SWIM zinc finger family protein [Bacillus sp. ISL-41]
MKISDFESFLEPVILERGHKLFKKGAVKNLQLLEENRVLASVHGTQTYSVELFLEGDGVIMQASCSCPYDWSETCKHLAAVFLALREGEPEKNQAVEDPSNELKQLLMQESKDELISIILQFARSHEEVERQLLLRYASPEEEITTAKALIRDFIKGAKSNGFIHWRRMDEAMQGAYMVLDNAEKKNERGSYVQAVKLALEIMPPVVSMTQYADDSGGEITFVTRNTMKVIKNAVEMGFDELSPDEQKEIFKAVLKEAKNKRYNDWDEWRFDLLDAIIPFGKDPKLRATLEKELEKLLKNTPQNEWSWRHTEQSIKQLQLSLLEVSGAEDRTIDAFIEENLRHDKFREKAIERALNRNDFEKAEQISLDGEKQDTSYAGLIYKWKDYRYQIYEQKGDLEHQRSMAYELVTSYYEYKDYERLKTLYNAKEWQEVFEKLLSELESGHSRGLYLTIITEEKLEDRILEYATAKPSSIVELYPYLIENHLSKVNNLFVDMIMYDAENASERRLYKQVCKDIRKYKKACGEMNSRKLIEELMSKYPRRPAFLDELQKIK